MGTVTILARQILQMFVLVGLGFLLFRGNKINLEVSKGLANILIYLSLPAMIIKGFLVERTSENILTLAISSGVAAALLLLSMVLSRLLFKKDPIASFAGAFSNPGFFGFPLIIALLGSDAVFCVAGFVALLNVGQWTYGVSVLTGQPILQGLKPKKLIKAPFVIAILIGLVLFFTQLQLPPLVSGCLDTVAGLNTPLAMFTIGVYLAQVNLRQMLRNKKVYLVTAIRLAVIPLLSMLLLALLPAQLKDMKMALLLVAACPVGANVAVYSQLHNQDYGYAVECVVVSTFLTVLTIPAIAALGEIVF